MKNTDTSVKSDGSFDIQHNARAMINLTLRDWQSTGGNLPPMRSGRKPQSSGARGIEGLKMIGGHERSKHGI